MKVIDKQEYTLTIDKEELNAILLGLSKICEKEWLANTIEFFGYGGVRRTKLNKVKEMLNILEKL